MSANMEDTMAVDEEYMQIDEDPTSAELPMSTDEDSAQDTGVATKDVDVAMVSDGPDVDGNVVNTETIISDDTTRNWTGAVLRKELTPTSETKAISSDDKVKTSIQKIIGHLHPEMTIDDSKGESVEEWLQKVEEAVTTLNDSSVATSEMESQISQLQSQVQHYKTIITETEGMLNQLQSQVEVEESRWKEKLLTLEEELDLLKRQNLNK